MHKAMLSTRSKIATMIFFLMGHLLKEHELKHMIHDCTTSFTVHENSMWMCKIESYWGAVVSHRELSLGLWDDLKG